MRRVSSNDIVITADDRLGTPQPGRRRAAAEDKRPEPKAKRRLPRLHLDFTPLQKLAAIGVAATALVVATAAVWHAGLPQRLARQTLDQILLTSAGAGFALAEVTLSGRVRTPVDQIWTALGVRPGDPILGLDIEQARDRLEALPTVRQAAIERRLPGALHLALVEREPVAVWQMNDVFALVDREGRQIPGPVTGFESLLLVVGEGAAAHAQSLLAMLATEPELAARVKAAVRVSNRRWNLRLDDAARGLEARLPEDDTEAAWHRLAELEGNRALSTRQVTMVDLRVSDRLVLKSERDPLPAPETRRKGNGA